MHVLCPDGSPQDREGAKAEAAVRQRVREEVLLIYQTRLEKARGLRRLILMRWIDWQISRRMNERLHLSLPLP